MIDQIAGFLQKNLVVVLSILVLPAKWGIVRFWGDREAEASAVMAVPEDLCYVVLGLVLGDVINDAGAFHAYFRGSSHVTMDIAVTVMFGFAFALVIHPLGQKSLRHFQGWRAAQNAAKDPEADAVPNADDNFSTLKSRHMLFFLIGYGLQLLVVFPWLHWVAKVIGASAGK